MNGRELIGKMIKHESFDRLAVYEGFWDETLVRWVKQGYPSEKVLVKGREQLKPVDPFQFFNYDVHRCGGFFDTEPLIGQEEIIEETDEWEIKRNGAGATLKWWKNNAGTPEHIDFKMTSREIWEKEYRPHLLQVDHRRFNGKWWGDRTLEDDRKELALGRARNQWTFMGHVGVWEIMRASLGDLTMYENLLLDPGWIKDFNRVYTDFLINHFKVLFKETGVPDGVWFYDDIAYRKGLFASPKMLRELLLPYYVELVSYFKDHYNLPAFFHSDGKLEQGLPLLVEAGFVGLHPLECKADNDLFEIAEKYGDRMLFFGGFDVRILETNDRALIEAKIIELLEKVKSRGISYVFHSDHTVTPLVNYDTYRFALDVYYQHRHF